jgi:4-amino-4-deoxy-L-arabinose transferase-like glycosyltransferase
MSHHLLVDPQIVNLGPSKISSWLTPLALFIFLSTFYYVGLGDYGLFDPWETHYGEVARDMVERGNYIDPFWGSPWDNGGVKRERAGFYSKPPLTMWMMSLGMNTFGANALGVRVLFPLLGLFALLSIYLALLRLTNQSTAVLATLCTGLIPSFAFLSHQAVTDGPMVCIVIMGMMALTMAFSPKSAGMASPLLKWGTITLIGAVTLAQLWIIWPMDRSPDAIYHYPDLGWAQQMGLWGSQFITVAKGKGWAQVILILPLALLYLYRLTHIKHARQYYFLLFFLACGLTVPAKGWLGWAPMGGSLVFYLLLSGEWYWITYQRVKLGLMTVFFTGHIWVVAMLGGHHPAWVNRFIYHDHINRLFKGVHSTDDGAFEYFFQWVGYGTYPLIALVPLALAFAFANAQRQVVSNDAPNRENNKAERVLLLLTTLWALIGFALFSKSSTKFHHYIFPVLPAITILVGIVLSKVWRGEYRWGRLMTLSTLGILLWVGADLVMPSKAPGQGAQHWVNLFTYKYDRTWPTYTSDEALEALNYETASKVWRSTLSLPITQEALRVHSEELDQALDDRSWNDHLTAPIRGLTIMMILAILLLSMNRMVLRRLGVMSTILAAAWACYFSLHIYLPTIAPHWSQWELWQEYYSRCDSYDRSLSKDQTVFEAQLLTFSSRVPADLEALPVWCKSPAIAFRMNWRGEAFYTHNTVVPALYTKDLKPILKTWGIWKQWQPNKKFYIFTERSRIKSELERSLPKYLKGHYKEVFGEGRRFVLLEVDYESK